MAVLEYAVHYVMYIILVPASYFEPGLRQVHLTDFHSYFLEINCTALYIASVLISNSLMYVCTQGFIQGGGGGKTWDIPPKKIHSVLTLFGIFLGEHVPRPP